MTAFFRAAEGHALDSFEDRLAMLRDGRLPRLREVDASSLAQLDGTRLPKSVNGLLFESPVQLASQVISNGKPVLIGAHSYMNDGGYLRGPIAIGRYCSIGRRVSIGAGAHAMAGLSTSPFFARLSNKADALAPGFIAREPRESWVVLMHDVWVGDGVVILPGVTIGTGAVIGANAVVNRDVDDYSIVAGAPAKPIGTRFDAGIAARLLATRYWELPPPILKTLPSGNVVEFLEAVEPMLASGAMAAEFPLYKLGSAVPQAVAI